MTAPTLKEALAHVERLGLAPLARIDNTQPKSTAGWSEWHRRRREVEAEAAAKLTVHGAAVSLDTSPVRIRFAGVSASSTMGLGQALRNWKTAAEKGLKHWGNSR